MHQLIRGTFHFHSTYSHDGRSTLRDIASVLAQRGFSFCVMTEHFEDFRPATWTHYLQELSEITQATGFVLIPGVEVNLDGLDTIMFPVRDYEEIARFASGGEEPQSSMLKVLAHPTKYSFALVVRHFEKYQLDGIELWNQQADGSLLPPFAFLHLLKTHSRRDAYRYFFGCDLHDVRLTVANTIYLSRPIPMTAAAIVESLKRGDFISRNSPTGIEYRNGPLRPEFSHWIATLGDQRYYRGRILRIVRGALRSCYRRLPRDTQHSLNNIKNWLRNKV